MFRKCYITLLILTFVLAGCSEGRGDWRKELVAGYAISCINSKQIAIVHRENPDAVGSSFVIRNYYVTAYWCDDEFICVKGIPTDDAFVTDEELLGQYCLYYLIQTSNDTVFGPYSSELELFETCSMLGVSTKQEWIKTSE